MCSTHSAIHQTGQGRLWALGPSILAINRAVRAVLIGRDHVEYDISSCHLAIFVAVVGGQATVVQWVLQQLDNNESKKELLSISPGGKSLWLVLLTVTTLQNPNCSVRSYMHRHGGAPLWYWQMISPIIDNT